jgi:hypothetical protein
MKTLAILIASLATSIREWFNPPAPVASLDWMRRTWQPILDRPAARIGDQAAHCKQCGKSGTVRPSHADDSPEERDDVLDSHQCAQCGRYALIAD